ncbi:hypothetical protein GWI33_015797 [Rhynchophorus ferrugineus]|uniref:Uncharacterized protein n=1 Tax=Rhynchophorus ferrugineus TaxID=354439 RepID=A0A834HZA4_RHYFE|nr:hypothetical protein GWI33_015797 [Rhynchophorus ferrugineus]
MATICFRPPPLPPNKKSMLGNGAGRCHKKGALLSSTYLSFLDPSEDVEAIEMTTFKTKKCRKVSHTNSLNRGREGRGMLTRSHSEGHLEQKGLDGEERQLSVSRYMRVLSGSWKNLLNRKLRACDRVFRRFIWLRIT